jgi:DNA-binding MarR family transcriptional regulator
MSNTIDVATIIAGLGGNPSTGMCCCPAHRDGNPSLKVAEGPGGKVLFKCFAGCSQDNVIFALRERNLWSTGSQRTDNGRVAEQNRPDAAFDGGRDNDNDDERADYRRFMRGHSVIRAALQAGEEKPTEYLQSRGINIVPRCLMLLPRSEAARYTGRAFPAMVAPIRSENGMMGAHITWLSADGKTKLAVKNGGPRRMFGFAKGGYVMLAPADPNKPFAVGEGIETMLSAMQLADLPGIAALSANNLGEISIPPCAEIIIAADNDEAGRKGAIKLAERLRREGRKVRIAMAPGTDRDWNDMLRDAGDDQEKLAEHKRAIIEAPEFADFLTPGEKREAELVRLARLKLDDSLAYEAERGSAAKALDVRRRFLDQEVAQRAEGLAIVDAKGPPPLDIEKLAASAQEIIESEDALELFARDCGKVVVGESKVLKLLYLVCTSRLFNDTMHAVVKGTSASGKSKLRQIVVDHFPPEDVVSFTAMSEKALLYIEDDFAHKILSMGEASAMDGKEQTFQNYLLRTLMSEGKLLYSVPQKVGDKIETVKIEKNGPVVFLVTTTRNALYAENETRMLSLEIDDSAEQTRAIMQKTAQTTGLLEQPGPSSRDRWHDFQRWVAGGETRVVVPFAGILSDNISDTKAPRLRRDFKQLLLAIQAHALLHRDHRNRDDTGRIVADIEHDYAAVRDLMADILATGVELKAQAKIVELIEVMEELDERGGVAVRALGKELNLGGAAVRRWLNKAEYAGYVENSSDKRGERHRSFWKLTGEKPKARGDLLPSVEQLQEANKTARRADAGVRGISFPASLRKSASRRSR